MKIRLAGVILAAAIGNIAHAGDAFDFAPYVARQVGSWPEAVAIGDVNGDRLDDVVLATTFYFDEPNDYSTFIYLQRPDGTLAPPLKTRYAQASSWADVELVDLDGDGVRDVVVGHDLGITTIRWDGSTFKPRQLAAGSACLVIASLDIDTDGIPDIACQSWSGGAFLFYGDGDGGVRTTVALETGAAGYDDMKAGDVNGDGLPDLVITSQQSSQWFVHVNNGAGGFRPEVAYPSPTTTWGLSAVAIGDLDGDGRNDVATVSSGNSPASGLYVYHQNAAGGLDAPIRFDSYDIPGAMLAHDLDKDGRSDLLVGHSGWYAIGRYMQGLEGLGAEQLTQAPFDGWPVSLAIGDINDDGCTDVGIAEHNSGLVTLAGMNCHRSRPRGDFDGDGRADLLWHNDATGASAIWRSGDFASQQAVTRVANLDWNIAATGDFDGDDTADIVWHNARTGAGTIWLSGNFATQQALVRVTNVAWRIVGAGDFDGDGRDDLVWRNATSGGNAIWKAGSFHAQLTVPAVTNLDWTIAGTGDLDGDGRDELVWRNAATGVNTAWRGANHRDNIAIAANVPGWSIAAIGDFDGDGMDDLFWRHADGRNAIWGAASSLRQMPVPLLSVHWTLAAAADYDGNGKDDVAWRHRLTGANAIWRAAAAGVNRNLTTVATQDWTIEP